MDQRFRAALTLAHRKNISIADSLSSPPEEIRLEELINNGIWSDEVEMLAKILSAIRLAVYGKHRKWQELLPERFIPSANYTVVPTASEHKQQVRSLSAMLDGLAKEYKK